jgi:solute carrier family 25 phosphate transporter 23/24/25/41
MMGRVQRRPGEDTAMKNADSMLKRILERLDTNKDGKVQYEEFRVFIRHAEAQLLDLFRTIDHDKDGRLDRRELQEAFRLAGIAVPTRKLNDFFNDMDINSDGFISFGEWRDFLMFMPVHEDGSPLHSVMSFYTSIVTVTAEGDSIVSDDRLNSLGRRIDFLMRSLFGAVLAIIPQQSPLPSRKNSAACSPSVAGSGGVSSPGAAPKALPETDTLALAPQHHSSASFLSSSSSSSQNQILSPTASSISSPASTTDPSSLLPAPSDSTSASSMSLPTTTQTSTLPTAPDLDPASQTESAAMAADDSPPGSSLSSGKPHLHPGSGSNKAKAKGLTSFVPDPGYFLAGAIAGGVSRTATAPFDRLKVYLLVNTQPGPNAANAASAAGAAIKKGRILAATRSSLNPILHAVQDIHGSGGVRGFFAGKF